MPLFEHQGLGFNGEDHKVPTMRGRSHDLLDNWILGTVECQRWGRTPRWTHTTPKDHGNMLIRALPDPIRPVALAPSHGHIGTV